MDNSTTLLLSFLFGTLWGSFFYTLALRFLDGSMKTSPREALSSRSRCPHCEKAISPLHLVPLGGFLMVRGKCRHCGAKISPLYPIAEIIFGLLLTLLVWHLGISLQTLVLFLLASLCISVSIIDWKSFTIPNSLVICFFVLSLYPVILQGSFKDNLFGFLFMGGFFLIILLIFPGSWGGGDVKLAAAMGFLVGLEQAVVILEVALISGALGGILYALITKKGLRNKIAFGPFLSIGFVTSLIWGRDIALLYYRYISF